VVEQAGHRRGDRRRRRDRGQTRRVEYDVKSLVTGNGALDLALRSTSNDGVDFASREDAAAFQRPVLEVTFVTSDSVAPSVPAGLTAKAVSTDRVDLSWGAASDEWGVTDTRSTVTVSCSTRPR
jgi:hypothetical protein